MAYASTLSTRKPLQSRQRSAAGNCRRELPHGLGTGKRDLKAPSTDGLFDVTISDRIMAARRAMKQAGADENTGPCHASQPRRGQGPIQLL